MTKKQTEGFREKREMKTKETELKKGDIWWPDDGLDVRVITGVEKDWIWYIPVFVLHRSNWACRWQSLGIGIRPWAFKAWVEKTGAELSTDQRMSFGRKYARVKE